MLLKTKFDIGDEVYFWSIENVKVSKGIIKEISMWVSMNSKSNYRYGIAELKEGKDVKFTLSELIPEHLVFKDRDEIIDFCMALTNDI